MKKLFFISLSFLFLLTCAKNVAPFKELIAFEEDGWWGYKDNKGMIVIRPQFTAAYDFAGEIGAVAAKDGWRYIDRNGRILNILPFIYDNGPDYFQEGLARFREDGKVGFLNEQGKVIIQAQFDFAIPFSEGYAAFCSGCQKREVDEHSLFKGGKWGFINHHGKVVISANFDEAMPYKDGRAKVKLDGKWIVIDKKGKIIN
jgi:hypothetical protein